MLNFLDQKLEARGWVGMGVSEKLKTLISVRDPLANESEAMALGVPPAPWPDEADSKIWRS